MHGPFAEERGQHHHPPHPGRKPSKGTPKLLKAHNGLHAEEAAGVQDGAVVEAAGPADQHRQEVGGVALLDDVVLGPQVDRGPPGAEVDDEAGAQVQQLLRQDPQHVVVRVVHDGHLQPHWQPPEGRMRRGRGGVGGGGAATWGRDGVNPPPPQGCIGRGRPAQTQPLSHWRQVPASMAFVTDSNRPKPLWQPPPTACLTASGAVFEAASLLIHPCPPGWTAPQNPTGT